MERNQIEKILCMIILVLFFVPISSYALVITSPQNGATYKEGDTVNLVAELSPGQTEIIVSVNFLVGGLPGVCADEIKTHPTYKCSFKLPPGSPKAITVMAYAVTFSGPIDSQEVNISVGLPSSIVLKTLKSEMGSKVYFTELADTEQLYIKGMYTDGVERDLRLGQTGTTYVSNNEKVATVNVDGLATAVGPGTAQITIRNGDKKLVLDVIVKLKR
jgi:hypothetical protein